MTAGGARPGVIKHDLRAGLDFSAEGISPAERDSLLRWYEETHGDIGLVSFAKFALTWYPDAFKRFRQYVTTVDEDAEALPRVIPTLAGIYLYSALGDGQGALYDVIFSRNRAASKAQVLETLSLGFMMGGPVRFNAVERECAAYLEGWEDRAEGSIEWPEGWYLTRPLISPESTFRLQS